MTIGRATHVTRQRPSRVRRWPRERSTSGISAGGTSARRTGAAVALDAVGTAIAEQLAAGPADRRIGEQMLDDALTAWVDARNIGGVMLHVDVDGMTLINRRHGAAVGDSLLAAIPAIIESATGSPLVGRCGDDTFFAFLPETDPGDRSRQGRYCARAGSRPRVVGDLRGVVCCMQRGGRREAD